MTSLGGLCVPEGAPGRDAHFLSAAQVRADWVGLSYLVEYWANELKTKLLPLGECERKHAELWMGCDGRVFVHSYISGVFFFAGDVFEDAIDGVLFGRRQPPLLTSWDSSVPAYGETYKRGYARNYYEATYTERE